MKLYKSIDERLKELGFCKVKENKYGASYIREQVGLGYTQVLDIMHKSKKLNIGSLIMSYQKGLNKDSYNNCVGLNYQETKLAMKKYRQLKRKYNWE